MRRDVVQEGSDASHRSRSEQLQSEEELRLEVQRLRRQVETLQAAGGGGDGDGGSIGGTSPAEKSGYLFKWKDRSIGWGGTKWGLRFVRIEHGQLSYFRSHDERSARYVLTLRDCAVRDEGSKVNKRHSATTHEAGSRFHVFSVYQRPAGAGADRVGADDDVIPLLRFSTESYAEKMQWIDLISQACAWCDTDEFASGRLRRRDGAPGGSAPTRAKRGTLPALVFEPPRPSRTPSGYNLAARGKEFRSKSVKKDAARSNKISYPPSKPMHRSASASYLSPEGSEVHNYRGLFNLLVILLVVSNFRLIQEAVRRHGFILSKLAQLRGFSSEAPLADFPFVSGLLIVQVFVVGAFVIEKALSQGYVGERIGMSLHFLNTNASLGVVMAITWCLIDQPVEGAILIMQAAITWLKLISYVHANHDYRTTSTDKHKATLALIKDLDASGISISYPENVTLGNIYYFWFAPTLTYQIAFPRAPFVRWTKVATLAAHLFVSVTLVTFFAAQVIAPNLDNLVRDLEANHGEVRIRVIGDYLLKLSITSTYIWLLMFYGFFHCFLNITAELLRFGDRVFYRDWWNASEVSAYWRLWNMPVHYWLVRHVYFPSVRAGFSKMGATFVVFFISAVMHEVLISIPCHMVRVHSFLAMMGQMPLIFLTKTIDRKYPGSSFGNIIFWISFCFVGQPMAILLYTIDYWEMNRHEELINMELEPKNVPTLKMPFAAIGIFFRASSEL